MARHQARKKDALAPGSQSSWQLRLLLLRSDHRARSLWDIEFLEQLPKPLAVFGEIDRFGRSADDVYAAALRGSERFSGVCPPNCTITPTGAPADASCSQTAKTSSSVSGLEVEAIAGVVVGRDRLGIAVDHDSFVAVLAQRVGGVAATIVELNSLPYAVRAGAEDDDFLFAVGAASSSSS